MIAACRGDKAAMPDGMWVVKAQVAGYCRCQ
jgi:hypothetical protein